MAKRVMILATNGFEQSELFDPKKNLEDAGIETELVSLETGEIKAWDKDDWGKTIKVDKTVDEVANCEGYDALLLPGGQINPDLLRVNDRAVAIVREFNAAGKPIAAICHAPWMLIEAGLVEGKTLTSYHSIRTDMKNAGANVVDQDVAEDGNLITSRNPDDIPAFSDRLISRVLEKVPENA